MAFKLLCCDGGGIRGLMTAMLIKNLDDDFQVISKADGFAGTSTGGLIALALAHGTSIETIKEIYIQRGKEIFDPNGWFNEEGGDTSVAPEMSSLDALVSGPGLFRCQYTNTGLVNIATDLFKDATLASLGTYVSVNSARLWDNGSWQAATLSNGTKNPYRDVLVRDAALATSAAPTYFPPHPIQGMGYFADGGTFANNPCMTALADLADVDNAPPMDQTVALSLGTGVVPQGIRPSSISDPLDWGVTHWMWPWSFDDVPAMAMLNLMMACTSNAATVQSAKLLGSRFCRGNVPMTKAIPLDGWEDVQAMIGDTKAYMKTAEWSAVRAWVEAHWVS